jgi:serine/threonine-protein kinase RsbW
VGNSDSVSEATNGADGSRTVRLTIPAKAEYITLSRLALAGLSRVRSLPEDTLADLKLALTEACSNSVRHAYDGVEGHVDISFVLHDDRLVVEVADDGMGFEPDGTGKLPDEELAEGGLGIAIIRSIADEVEIDGGADGRGSRLRFVKRL